MSPVTASLLLLLLVYGGTTEGKPFPWFNYCPLIAVAEKDSICAEEILICPKPIVRQSDLEIRPPVLLTVGPPVPPPVLAECCVDMDCGLGMICCRQPCKPNKCIQTFIVGPMNPGIPALPKD